MRGFLVFGAWLISSCSADKGHTTDCDREEEGACAYTAAGPVPFAKPASLAKATLPILFHHGFNASSTNSWSFHRVVEELGADYKVVATDVPPFHGVEKRVEALKAEVDRALAMFCAPPAGQTEAACTKVHLVAHSMGGLDARHLADDPIYGAKIASVTTISTPHRGTELADAFLKIYDLGVSDSLGESLNELAESYAETFTTARLAAGSNLRAAFSSLSVAETSAYNEQHASPGQPFKTSSGTYVQSFAGVSRGLGGYRPSAIQRKVLEACRPTLCTGGDPAACAETHRGDIRYADQMAPSLVAGSALLGLAPQDGMVTVESAKWGNFRGCFPADHLDEVGQPRRDSRAHEGDTRFDHIAFYFFLADDLARKEAAGIIATR